MTTARPGAGLARLDPDLAREAARLPEPGEAARLSDFLPEHPAWSVCWDKRHGVWRAAEDDPDSALYAESRDLDTVLGYITTHS